MSSGGGDARTLVVAAAIDALCERLATPAPPSGPTDPYDGQAARVRELVESVAPTGAAVAVVSRGDAELLRFRGRVGHHFPSDDGGVWAGFHPADSDDALDRLREAADRWRLTHLAVPESSRWWLDHYGGWAGHLRDHHVVVADVPGTGVVVELRDDHRPRELPVAPSRVNQLAELAELLADPADGTTVVVDGRDPVGQVERALRGGCRYLALPADLAPTMRRLIPNWDALVDASLLTSHAAIGTVLDLHRPIDRPRPLAAVRQEAR